MYGEVVNEVELNDTFGIGVDVENQPLRVEVVNSLISPVPVTWLR